MYAITIFHLPGHPQCPAMGRTPPTPVPAADEVLIKIAAAGVNRADILQRQGPSSAARGRLAGYSRHGGRGRNHRHRRKRQALENWAIRSAPCCPAAAMPNTRPSPKANARRCRKNFHSSKPPRCRRAVITVWANLFEAGEIGPGAIGARAWRSTPGIGTIATSMVSAYGAKIFVTAGSDEKCAACRKLGADLAINYKTDDFVAVIEPRNQTARRRCSARYGRRRLRYAQPHDTRAPKSRHVSIAVQGGRFGGCRSVVCDA